MPLHTAEPQVQTAICLEIYIHCIYNILLWFYIKKEHDVLYIDV